MFIGDVFLGFHNTMFFTYISLTAAVALGLFIKQFKFSEIIFGGLVSSVCFFLITNFGAWMTLDMYEKNFEEIINSLEENDIDTGSLEPEIIMLHLKELFIPKLN